MAATATTVDSTAEPVAGEPVEAATSTEPAQEYTTDHTDQQDPIQILIADLPLPLETSLVAQSPEVHTSPAQAATPKDQAKDFPSRSA
jgi:hypothetical protein